MDADHPDITERLSKWEAGDPAALEKLMPVVYQELRKLASSHLRRERPDHTLQPTALINEVYLRLEAQAQSSWRGRAHFFGVASHLMRQILVDHARKRQSAKRGGGEIIVQFEDASLVTIGRPNRFLDLDRALTELASFDARKSRMLELHYFGGLSHEECAEVMQVSVGTVRRDMRLAQAWLSQQLSL
jgi:RNA polymerase sigma factor (TIGR02999 family)